MSIEQAPPDYFGIPSCTDSEAQTIRESLEFGKIEEGFTLESLGLAFIDHNPEIDRVIDHDVEHYKSRQAPRGITFDDLKDTEAGIRDGYALFIGCAVWMRFSRDGSEDLGVFMQEISGTNTDPLLPTQTIKRIKEVRTGKALMERNTQSEKTRNSSDWALRDAEEYFAISRSLDTALDDYMTEIADGSEPVSDDPYVFGVLHGIANAIEMLIQANEEHSFSSIRTSLH